MPISPIITESTSLSFPGSDHLPGELPDTPIDIFPDPREATDYGDYEVPGGFDIDQAYDDTHSTHSVETAIPV